MEVNAHLDTPLAWLVSFLILGSSLLVVAASCVMTGWAVREVRGGADRRPLLLVPAALTLWAAAAIATSLTFTLDFRWFLPFAVVPILAGVALSYTPLIAQVLAAIPTHWMVGLQTYRVVGAVFLYPYLAHGIVTPGFAWPAGVGDILTGLAAPVIAWGLSRDPERWRLPFYGWSLFGIADLIVAPLSAAAFGFNAVESDLTFAITAIPLFLGPPFGILVHVLTWRSFELRRQRAEEETPPGVVPDLP